MPGLVRGAACAAAGLALLTGCSDDDDSDVFGDGASSVSVVAVDPQYFLGNVPCAQSDGAMQSYVATLTDRSLSPEFVLPSSSPVSCSDRVQFRFVVTGHEYSAQIDGYEQAPDELVPFGGNGSGSRRMRLLKGGAEVTPSWTTACGENKAQDDDPGAAIAGTRADVRGCEPLFPQAGIGTTAVAVDPRLALGALTCGTHEDQVSRFDVLPEAPGLVPFVNVSCGSIVPFLYIMGIEPGLTYRFRIEAEVAGTRLGASCQATAKEGVRTTASCTALTSVGALAIPLGSILVESEPGCQARVDLLAGGVVVSSRAPVPCDETMHASHLAPGSYNVEVTVLTPMAAAAGSCAGEVRAGATTVCF